MIDLKSFTAFLEKNFQFICGVPCTYFKDLLSYLENQKSKVKLKHVFTTREDEAVGIASGVAFSGKQTVLYMQNSGLGTIGDALTSLVQLYKLSMLLLISYRGLEPDRNFPEHSLMGDVTEAVLKAYNLPFLVLSEDKWMDDITQMIKLMEKTLSPVALLIKKGVLSE